MGIAQLDGGAGPRHTSLGLLHGGHLARLHAPCGGRFGLGGQGVRRLRQRQALLRDQQVEERARDVGTQFGAQHRGILRRRVTRSFCGTRPGGALAAKFERNVQLRRHRGAIAAHVLGREGGLGIAPAARLVERTFAGGDLVTGGRERGVRLHGAVESLLQGHAAGLALGDGRLAGCG